MGIYDRDYMRDEDGGSRKRKRAGGGGSNGSGSPLVDGIVIVLLIVIFLMLVRVPLPVFIKIPAMIGVLVVIYFRIFGGRSKLPQAPTDHYKAGCDFEANREYSKAARSFRMALQENPESIETKIRLLVCLDCSNQKSKAAAVVDQLDGLIFSDRQTLEVEVFASKYRKLFFEDKEGGQKLILGGDV